MQCDGTLQLDSYNASILRISSFESNQLITMSLISLIGTVNQVDDSLIW